MASPKPCSVISRIVRPSKGKPFHWAWISGRFVVIEGFRVVGTELDGLPVCINRLGVLALPRQRDPQVVPGVGEIGAQLDRSLKRGKLFIKFILARQGDTEALENPRLVGPDADCLVIGGHCFVEPTLVGKRVAQADSHSISGYLSNDTSSSVSGSVSWYDRGQDEDAFAACGSDSSTGDQYTFSDAESTEDNFVLSIQVPGEFNGVASVYSQSTLTMTGSTSTGPAGSSFSYSE
jgi:hypothetical protein